MPLLASRRPPDALIAHMCPIYLVLAAPFTKIRRVPTILWYTHWAVHRTLRLATALADVALSVDRRSFPLDRPKVSGIGHGIDVTQFAARTERVARRRRAAPPARARPHVADEGFDTSIKAVAQLRKEGVDLTLDIYGAVVDRGGAPASPRRSSS